MDPQHVDSRRAAGTRKSIRLRLSFLISERRALGLAAAASFLLAQSIVRAACAHEEPGPPISPTVTSRNLELVAQFNDYPQALGERGYNSCWAYVHEDGREYAVLGVRTGTAIYNISDPATAYRVAFVPGPNSVWRGMRQYRNWLYVVTEGVGPSPPPGLQIIRMTDPENPQLVKTHTGSFIRAHTISTDSSRALLFLNGTRNSLGLQSGMLILSLQDPENPIELSTWPGGPMTGVDSLYVHDSVVKGDLLYASTIYAGAMRVLNIENPSAPVPIASFKYPGGFTHSSAPDTSGRYHYICDEAPGEPVKVFDVSDLSAPRLVNTAAGNPKAVIHNAHVEGDTLYLANFSQGVRLFDISDPAHPAEFAWADARQEPFGYYYSVWNVCPYFPSRSVIASDMEYGLFVYRPVRDFGLLRIEVTDHVTGSPIGGAHVLLIEQGDSLVTPASGVVRFGPNPGLYTVRVRCFGYVDAELSAPVSLQTQETVKVALSPKSSESLSGVVRDALTLEPLGGAEIHIHGTPLHLHTDATGSFSVGQLPLEDHKVEVHRPGYVPRRVALGAGSWATAMDILLAPALTYDPLETESGWLAGDPLDDATAGGWVRVDPIGTGAQLSSAIGPGATFFAAGEALESGARLAHDENEMVAAMYPHPIQPEDDRTPDPGTHCFVTGQGTVPEEYWAGNVDGGKTTLVSPALDLSGLGDPHVSFWRWFYSDGDAADWMAISISNDDGMTWVPVDTLRGIHNRWTEQSVRLIDHLAPSERVRLRFQVEDGGGGTMVEGAVDDLITYDAATAPLLVDEPRHAAGVQLRAPWPNPSSGAVRLAIELPRTAKLLVEVLDLSGRRVRVLHHATTGPGTHVLEWNGADQVGHPVRAGLYFVRASAGSERALSRIVRLR